MFGKGPLQEHFLSDWENKHCYSFPQPIQLLDVTLVRIGCMTAEEMSFKTVDRQKTDAWLPMSLQLR